MGIFAALKPFYTLIFKRLAFLVLLFSQLNSFGQGTDIGFIGGQAYYFGDLGESFHHFEADYASGFFLRRNFSPYWSLRGSMLFGQVSGADSVSSEAWKQNRNLSFRSRLIDASVVMEFNFFKFSARSGDKKFSPYIFGGLGLVTFNPQGFYDGEWRDLQPLHTEGQETSAYPDRKEYSRTAITIPFGFGYKVMIGKFAVLSAQASFRKTFTDYLDDVSTTYVDPSLLDSDMARDLADRSIEGDMRDGAFRGDSYNKDWYGFLSFTLVIQFRRSTKNCHDFGI